MNLKCSNCGQELGFDKSGYETFVNRCNCQLGELLDSEETREYLKGEYEALSQKYNNLKERSIMISEMQVERVVLALEKMARGVESMANNYGKCFLKEDLTITGVFKDHNTPDPEAPPKTDEGGWLTREQVRAELLKLVAIVGQDKGFGIGGEILKRVGNADNLNVLDENFFQQVFDECQQKIKEMEGK